ncbi:hypothetical protein TELCIR_15409 [Teladorsagia circumcincta]|uniref:Uncharacterized protein n=1 Tax=Teladorsagia circumcincta TaxID=45464 RepID=A0A2G9U0H5_TELCI|nr:hypothetical protein TELCIR_15409 [Teladorsagia circumcincta]
MQAKLKLNQKPESDGTNWKTPKIDLSIDMETLALAIGKFQYQDILLFLEAQERFNLATQYLKYRPHLNEYRGHYKEWWHFAYTAILEEKVRRRRNNWSWPRMRAHRQLVRAYRDAWLKQQTTRNPGSEVTDVIKVKARSVTGLAHAVENRSRLVLDIQIQPATIYVSEGGVYDSQKPTILADLGHLSITTVESDPLETDEEKKEDAKSESESESSKSTEQQVQLELDLHLDQIGLVVSRGDEVLCDVSIVRMGCKLQMRTFDMVVNAELGAIRVSMPMFKSLDPMRQNLYIIDNNEHEGSLMTLKFVQANPESPFFVTEYRSTEQAIDFKFRKLNIALHQEGLLELKLFGEKMQREITALQKGKEGQVEEAMETGRKLSRQVSQRY